MSALNIRAAVGVLLMATLQVGCASQHQNRHEGDQSFSDAVRECRPKRSGRPTQNTRSIPAHGPVAECLKRHGCNPDGTRK